MIYYIATLLVLSSLALAFWIRRRRILQLDWPERFSNLRKLRRYSAIYLTKNGWLVGPRRDRQAEFIISKPSHSIGVQLLIENEYYSRIPDHFVNSLVLASNTYRMPFILITDFQLRREVVEQCHKRKVFPIFYKDLGKLESMVPSMEEFKRL